MLNQLWLVDEKETLIRLIESKHWLISIEKKFNYILYLKDITTAYYFKSEPRIIKNIKL